FPPHTARQQQIRIDLVGRDVQRVETVADERQVIQTLHGFSARPGSLSETGAEEVVRHAPVGRLEKRERGDQRSAARNARVPSGQSEALVESPANVSGNDDRDRKST